MTERVFTRQEVLEIASAWKEEVLRFQTPGHNFKPLSAIVDTIAGRPGPVDLGPKVWEAARKLRQGVDLLRKPCLPGEDKLAEALNLFFTAHHDLVFDDGPLTAEQQAWAEKSVAAYNARREE